MGPLAFERVLRPRHYLPHWTIIWHAGLNRWRELLLLPGFGATVGGKDFLPQPDGLRRDLDVFIVGDEVESLIEAERAVRNKADGLIGHRGAHVGLLLFLGDVDVDIVGARILTTIMPA